MLFRTYRYSRWDGTQNIFDLDADQLMDMLSDDVLNNGDIMQALRDLLRQGMQNRDGEQMPGLRQLMEQLKDQRRQQMQQHNMDSVLDDLKERLDDIIDTERRGIQRRLDEARQQVEESRKKTVPSRKPSTTCWNSGPTATWTASTTSRKASAASSGSSWSTTSWTRRPSRSSRNCWIC